MCVTFSGSQLVKSKQEMSFIVKIKMKAKRTFFRAVILTNCLSCDENEHLLPSACYFLPNFCSFWNYGNRSKRFQCGAKK